MSRETMLTGALWFALICGLGVWSGAQDEQPSHMSAVSEAFNSDRWGFASRMLQQLDSDTTLNNATKWKLALALSEIAADCDGGGGCVLNELERLDATPAIRKSLQRAALVAAKENFKALREAQRQTVERKFIQAEDALTSGLLSLESR